MIQSRHRLLTSVAWQLDGVTTFALEGSAFVAGALVQWLRDGLGIIERSADIEALAASVPDSGGVVVVPALAGLGAPHWRPEARGLIAGLTRGTTRAHLARAALEAIALQIVELVSAMQGDSGRPLRSLRVDGGATANDLLMQIQADLLGVEVVAAAGGGGDRPWRCAPGRTGDRVLQPTRRRPTRRRPTRRRPRRLPDRDPLSAHAGPHAAGDRPPQLARPLARGGREGVT